MYFVEVILPLALDKTFTYQISADEFVYIQPGMRIAVPFGKNKIYTALSVRTHQQAPSLYEAKEIHQIIDSSPIITTQQLQHWFWIAQYYMCTIGEVYKNAIPTALLLESETLISRNLSIEVNSAELSDEQYLIWEALQKQSTLKVEEISSILNKKNILPTLNELLEKNVIQLQEEINETYKPKLTKYIRLAEQYASGEHLQELLEQLKNAHKQREALLQFFQLQAKTKKPISQAELTKEHAISATIIKGLVDKGIFESYTLQTDRIAYKVTAANKENHLSPEQQVAFEQILTSFKDKNTTLLHGITSSGKTEIYIETIKQFLTQGSQILYLVPEISLSPQLLNRLREHFGDCVAIYHSKFSQNERIEVWHQVLHHNPKAQIIIGARTALFLPFSNLELIIVDEEHEGSYKQQDPAPRFHARDAAIVLAEMHQAKTLLGSATPSIETYYNTHLQKFGLVNLTKRYTGMRTPEIEVIDLKDKYFRKQMSGHFSDTLLEEIKTVTANGNQVILFQNKRGYAPILECNSCGHIPQCPSCDVSLTFHKQKGQLRCHYCGYSMAKPTRCHSCKSVDITTKGFGTEQVELEIKELLPELKVLRMDRDTTRGKHGHEKIIDAFKNREADILIGTQMLAKGLDFDNITLVGVLNADSMLYLPDFRAYERAYQLLTQVAGRAGRSDLRSKVLIQTFNPTHSVIQKVLNGDYQGLYKDEYFERQNFQYPPFYKLIRLTLKHRDYQRLNEGSKWLYQSLKNNLPMPILGPEEPAVSRIRNEYLRTILIKIPAKHSLKQTKTTLARILQSFESVGAYRSIKVIVNVDYY